MALAALPFSDAFPNNGSLNNYDISVVQAYTPYSTATIASQALVLTLGGVGGYNDWIGLAPQVVMAHDPVVSWQHKYSSLANETYFRMCLRSLTTQGNSIGNSCISVEFQTNFTTVSCYSVYNQQPRVTYGSYANAAAFSTSLVNYEIRVNGPDVEFRHWTTTRPTAANHVWSGVPLGTGGTGFIFNSGTATPSMSLTMDNLAISEFRLELAGTWNATGDGSMGRSAKMTAAGSLARTGSSTTGLVQSGMATTGALQTSGDNSIYRGGSPRVNATLGLAGSSSSQRSASVNRTGTLAVSGGSGSTRSGKPGMTRTLGLTGSGTQSRVPAAQGAGLIPRLPPNVSTGLLTGSFTDHSDGTPMEGTVTITSSAPALVNGVWDTMHRVPTADRPAG